MINLTECLYRLSRAPDTLCQGNAFSGKEGHSVTAIRLLASVLVTLLSACSCAASENDADRYSSEIRQLITSHCLGCHSTEKKKGSLDLERFGDADQVRADIETWQTVLEMIERAEMPPKGKNQFTKAQRRTVTTWIRQLLDREARLRAGDPGPLPLRRLNNAEYNYAIRDLTGVDLRPAQRFPADGAAGEGFLNATDALTITPDQMSKYLDAAKGIAEHAVLLPDGFRFSPSRFRAEWSSEVLDQIRAIYAKYANEFGQIPLDRYLRATIEHRDALRSGKTSIAIVAEEERLSQKYLRKLWDALQADRHSLFLSQIRANWQDCSATEDVDSLVSYILELQALLWHKRDPIGMHALDDRYVPPGISLANSQTYKLDMPPPAKDGSITFYLSSRAFGAAGKANLIVSNARFEAKGKQPRTLRDVLEESEAQTPESEALDPTRFGRHPDGKPLPKDSLIVGGSESLPVRLTASQVQGRTLILDVRVEPDSSPGIYVHFDVRPSPAPATVKRGVDWTDVASTFERPFLAVHAGDRARTMLHADANEFRQMFPARVCYPGVVVIDTVVTLERYHRGDSFLSQLLLDDGEQKRLDRLWQELHFISLDALQVRDSLATLVQGELDGYKEVADEVRRRAKRTEDALVASESRHIDSLVDFAAHAYRRPVAKRQQQALVDLYQSLRKAKLPHDEAFRSLLARVLVSPHFLYRPEVSPPTREPARVSDWELATRLSFFLWSSIPDQELRRHAAAGTLEGPQLESQMRRMLKDKRIRALAVEFGSQWLEVRDFDAFQGKNQELFPTFDDELRRAMNEETILLFQSFFQADLPFRHLVDADYTFVNERLAAHYGLTGVAGEEFRRVNRVEENGRGGLLALGSVLSKHSGASRTSPVLRGNWIAEILLGEKLPRPPDDVPKLPESETADGLSIRQLVERHAKLPECAVCHQRIDPLGFALEEYDTIGRRRKTDAAGRPIDARAQLKDGKAFDGVEGLRHYLLDQRRDDFTRQFCRKLLGFALGRRVILSDRQLLDRMTAELSQNGRVSAAILAIVRSRQFQFIRGSDHDRDAQNESSDN